MITAPLSSSHLAASVMAVPPLSRQPDFTLDEEANERIVRHLEAGGVRLLLYGGNANLYHVPLSEYDAILAMLARIAGPDTLVIPSAGPSFGMLLDQAKMIRRFAFPTVMVLPQQGITTSTGVATGLRRFVEAAGTPALLYIKHDGFIDLRLRGPETLAGDARGDSPWRLDGGRTHSDGVRAAGKSAKRAQPDPRAARGGGWCRHREDRAAAAPTRHDRGGTPADDRRRCRGVAAGRRLSACESYAEAWAS